MRRKRYCSRSTGTLDFGNEKTRTVSVCLTLCAIYVTMAIRGYCSRGIGIRVVPVRKKVIQA